VLSVQEIYHFIQTSYPRVVVAVAFLTGSVAAAEDAVQEALVRAWVKAEKGEAIESLPAWVTTVAMNLSRKAWRRALAERRAKERLPPAHGSSGTEIEEAIDVKAALARLPRRQRETAVLRYVLDMDTREVAGRRRDVTSRSSRTMERPSMSRPGHPTARASCSASAQGRQTTTTR
jgi:RNA polymerase sigma factor (sigma-70 family)